MAQRGKEEKSAIMSAAGWLMSFVVALMAAVRKLGGNDEQMYALGSPASADVIDHMAALITGKVVPTAPVDWWNKLLAMTITACRFVSYVNEAITGVNFPYEAGDMDEHELIEVTIDRTMSTDDVLKKITDLGLRPARLMDLLRWWLANPEKWTNCVVVALGSVWGGRVPYVRGGGSGRSLDLGAVEDDWSSACVFLAVRVVSK